MNDGVDLTPAKRRPPKRLHTGTARSRREVGLHVCGSERTSSWVAWRALVIQCRYAGRGGLLLDGSSGNLSARNCCTAGCPSAQAVSSADAAVTVPAGFETILPTPPLHRSAPLYPDSQILSAAQERRERLLWASESRVATVAAERFVIMKGRLTNELWRHYRGGRRMIRPT